MDGMPVAYFASNCDGAWVRPSRRILPQNPDPSFRVVRKQNGFGFYFPVTDVCILIHDIRISV